MLLACPRCGASLRPDAPSCGDCEYVLAPTAGTFLTLTFPAEHPDYDVAATDARAPTPAPVLMPGTQFIPVSPPIPDRQPAAARKTPVAVIGAIAFVLVVGIVVTVALLGGRDNDQTEAQPGGGPAPETVTGDTAPQQNAPAAPPPTPVPTDENSALQALQDQVRKDHAAVESLTEHWVPQLSSKKPGLVANGTTFDHRAVWSDFTSLAARYPGALLLWSGNFSSFRLPDFWVTIAPHPFDSGELANGWCDNAGIGPDDCFAKRITHSGTYADSTLMRR